MDRCEEEVGELEELITLDVLNHYLYKVLIIITIFVSNIIIIDIIILIIVFIPHDVCFTGESKFFFNASPGGWWRCNLHFSIVKRYYLLDNF